MGDYRKTQLAKMKNVEVHAGAELSAQDILDYGAEAVILATGASWRRDGVSYANAHEIPGNVGNRIFTPDNIMHGKKIKGLVIVFNDDQYYRGCVIAE